MKKIIMPVYKSIISTILLFTTIVSCEKFVEIPLPTDQLTTEFVFTNDNAALQSITGIYSEMMNGSQQFSDGYTTFYTGMCADDLFYFTPGIRDEFVKNDLSPLSHGTIEAAFWNPCYRYIYAANKCLEGSNESDVLSWGVKQIINGEAKFIRAFCYFHLVNLFGDVPLVLSTDYKLTQSLPRTSASNIYDQIIADLKDAENSLMVNYPAIERTRPNKWAVSALLARVYLFRKDWVNAESKAESVINSGLYSLTNNLNAVFQINSNETIWQLRPVNPSRNTWEGGMIIPASASSAPTYLLTSTLIDAFEANDLRKTNWTKSHDFGGQTFRYPYKYKIRTGSNLSEYYVVIRLAELYLIRAEARTQQNNLAGAINDLNVIRIRAGLPGLTNSLTKSEALFAIERENRFEFFAEWGHRWFDLKRTNRADAVLSTIKPLTWQPTDVLWPIPQNQIRYNSSLIQNQGY